MKGTIVGISVFVMLAFAVAIAAAGAVSQAYNGAAASNVTAMAVTEFEGFGERPAGEEDSGIYQAFTYV